MRRDPSTHSGYDRSIVEALTTALLARIDERRALLVGLSGLQASGKTTLAHQLRDAARERGVATEVLSLDDFYLGRRARATLARRVHPLLATRGVPGTHDIALLERTIGALRHASPRKPARIPRFDKGRDTRVAPSHWRKVVQAPRLIVLEGWCIGVTPEDPCDLVLPVNALERREDQDGRWRHWVNTRLADEYVPLWRKLDVLVALIAPSFAVIERWRDQPEAILRRRGAPRALSKAALHRFLMYYERLSRRALRILPKIADIVVRLGAEHDVRSVRIARKSSQR